MFYCYFVMFSTIYEKKEKSLRKRQTLQRVVIYKF